MGMFEKIFGRREQPAKLKNAQIFRMLEGYTGNYIRISRAYDPEMIGQIVDVVM